ncbi:MAG: GNAT family N-acetyltransferase [Rhizobiales bacterium]|nr:GNAT family N-acetyltransferase [Hyphomicrobiales bacterium]
MTTLATLPAVETPHIVLREIEMRDCQAFTGFMTQETYQRHIALKLANEAEVKAFVQRSVARQGDERRNVFHLAAAMGFGTEIGRALLGLAFERLKAERIWCKVMAENEASKKLARRIGLRHVQSHADYPAGAGRFAAVEVLALTAAEYFDLPY